MLSILSPTIPTCASIAGEVAVLALMVLPRLKEIATYHSEVDCRQIPELRDSYHRWASGGD